jgi:hypothetical protein
MGQRRGEQAFIAPLRTDTPTRNLDLNVLTLIQPSQTISSVSPQRPSRVFFYIFNVTF